MAVATKRKSNRAPARKPTARKGKKRTLSPEHKNALAEGRTMSAAVDAYISAIGQPKRRGRKVTVAQLETRLKEARGVLKTASGVDKVLAAQSARDLELRIARTIGGETTNVKQLEQAFIKICPRFSQSRNISYGAWREAGVPADVLRRAGIARTRSA